MFAKDSILQINYALMIWFLLIHTPFMACLESHGATLSKLNLSVHLSTDKKELKDWKVDFDGI